MAQVSTTAPQEQAHGAASKGEELCLLSLDGGGVRGLSSLQILKQLMELIDPKNPPKPCDYFDMIGGTSTGGLIAIMLGRLRLTVDECIDEYKKLSDKVFTKLHHRVKVNGNTQGRFDHEALVVGVQDLLERKGLSKDELLKDDSKDSCKTFVCTTSNETADTVVLPSYYTQRWGTDMLNKTKIWEAARATSAATTFFDPITIGTETFVDGATGANNPIQELMIEAYNLWSEKRPGWKIEDNLQCVVSVGTGMPSLEPFGKKLWDVPQTLLSIATDTERTAEKWQRTHDTLFREKRAFRFNVMAGLENIGLEDSKRQGDILAATKRYIALQNVLDQMNDCAANLQTRECFLYTLGTGDINRMLYSKTEFLGDGVWQKSILDNIMHASRFQLWCQNPGQMIWCVTKTQDQLQDQILAAYLEEELSSQFRWNCLYYAFTVDAGKILRTEELKQEARYGKGPRDERQPKQDGATTLLLFRHLIAQTVMRIVGDSTTKKRFSKLSPQDRAMVKRSAGDDVTFKDQMTILTQLFQLTGRRNVIFLECIDVLDLDEIQGLLLALRLLVERLSSHVSVLISGYPKPDIILQMSGIPAIDEQTEYYECLETLVFEELHIRRDQVTDAEPRTNHWIWSHPAYLLFKRQRTGILWIEGKPGSGKSVLAKTIQRDLRATKPCNPDSGYYFRVGDWFYHGRRGGAFISHQSFLKSILYQLLKADPELFGYFRETYRQRHDAASSRTLWNYNILLNIFENMSKGGIEMMCVLDALDEAQNVEILELVERLTVKCPLSRTKFIILSRGNMEIERVLHKYHHILLEEENSADISVFIESEKMSLSRAMHALDFESEFQVRPSHSRIPRNSRPLRAPGRFISRKVNDKEKEELQKIGKYIEERANGTFLWVKLVLDQLHTEVEKGIGTFGELRKCLKECPEKLTDYYHQITTNIHCGARERNIRFARTALMWISGASELAEFTLEELWDALAVSLEEEDDQDQDNIQDAEERGTDRIADRRIPIRSFHEFRRKIHGICGPLVEVLKPSTLNEHSEFTIHGGQSTVQLMHQTVKDFLSQPEAAGKLHFYPDKAIQMVKRLCMRYVGLTGATVPRPFTGAGYNYGAITAAEMLEWLDDKKLLRFALHTQPKWEHREISVFQQIFCTALAPPEPDTLDWEFVDALQDDLYPGMARLNPQAISAGRLFHLACSEGFVVAASNLIAITSCLPNWWKTNCRVVKHAVMLAASEVNISSLVLKLKPGTLHKPGKEPAIPIIQEPAFSSGDGAGRIHSPSDEILGFFPPSPPLAPVSYPDEIPSDKKQPQSWLESIKARATADTNASKADMSRYMPGGFENESADDSDWNSLFKPYILAKARSAEGESSKSKSTGLSANENIHTRSDVFGSTMPSIGSSLTGPYSTTLSRPSPRYAPALGSFGALPGVGDESDAADESDTASDSPSASAPISSVFQKRPLSAPPRTDSPTRSLDDFSFDEDDLYSWPSARLGSPVQPQTPVVQPQTPVVQPRSPELPPIEKNSLESSWISLAWTVVLEKQSTKPRPKTQFSTTSKFATWCNLLDKTCGGKAYMLREKRQKLYGQDDLPNVEDVEEAIGVVLQKFREVDYDVPTY